MYYKTKKIRIKKDNRISLTVADSSIRPLRYFTTEYNGTLGEFLKSMYEGNFQLSSNKDNIIYSSIIRAISYIIERSVDGNGLTWDNAYYYKIPQRDVAISMVCDEYAKRILANDFSNGKSFGEALGNMIEPVISEGIKLLREKRASDAQNGVYRISCAAHSIFDGYNLLKPYEEAGFILAPASDYKGGLLKTDRSKIVFLGKESDNLYPFLSFSGINISKSDYISKYHSSGEVFDLVDRAVEAALNAGLVLIANPYIGYKKTAA